MKINNFEVVGIAASIACMALALWLIRLESTNDALNALNNTTPKDSELVYIGEEGNQSASVASALSDASSRGVVSKLVVDDVVIGTGEEVTEGDTVVVNYIGTLQNGQQFDSSYERGTPFTFEIGKGRVIAGWDTGVLGMKTGGKRILVIPSDMAYGKNGAGPIPANATLVFAIELLEIK